MKICYIVSMNHLKRGGLFYSTHNRILNMQDKASTVQYSVRYYDCGLVKYIKKLLNKPIIEKVGSKFVLDKLSYEYIYIKRNLWAETLRKLGLENIIFAFSILKNKEKMKNTDIISAHWVERQGYYANIIKKILKKPYVVTAHGSDINAAQSSREKKRVVKVLKDSEFNIFVSEKLKSEAEKIYEVHEKNKVVYNGVDFDFFKRKSELEIINYKDELKISREVKLVGYAGNFFKVKGVDRIPEIFNEINKKFFNKVQFLLAGDGDLKGNVEHQLDQLSLNYKFLGRLSSEEMVNYLNILDVLILPSRNEGLPLIILEAESCGTKVVATDVGGVSEVLLSEYVVQNDGDLEINMSEKVIKIMKEENKTRKNKSLRKFSWKTCKELELEIIEGSIYNYKK